MDKIDIRNENVNRTGDQNDAKKTEALKQAEKHFSHNPILSPEPDPAADLDEGEFARLERED